MGSKLEAMWKAGSDCINVICPQCFYQFDTGQMLAGRSLNLRYKIPVLFYFQLLGLAMGYSLEDIYYGSHRVKSKDFESKVRRIQV